MKNLFFTLSASGALVAMLGCSGSSSNSNSFFDTATAVTVLDVDGDGHPDVVTIFDRAFGDGSDGGFVSTRLGQGGGLNFAAPVDSPGGVAPGSMAVGDLDQDGHLDLVLLDQASPTVTLLYGNGGGSAAGTFGPSVNLQLGQGRYPYAAAVADFNGDGKLDIAVAARGGQDLLIFQQTPSGSFGPAPVSVPLGATPLSIATAVLEPGGHADLAIGLDSGQLAILQGNGDGTFQTPVKLPCGTTPAAIKIMDLNGDGQPDIAVADYGNSSAPSGLVWIFLNQGTAFNAGVSYPTGGAYTLDLAIGDLDGDGKPDIAIANFGLPGDPGSLAVLINQGGGVFGAPAIYPGLQGPTSVAIADVDGDGKNDLVSADGVGVVRLQSPTAPGQFLSPVQLYY